MRNALLHGFYLGDVLVEPLKGLVTGQGPPRHLPSKASEVLLHLASRSGKLYTRQELLDSVWGDGHGSDEALGHAISELRHALDDHPDDPKYIQTVPTRGYRLVADVRVVDKAINEIAGAEMLEIAGSGRDSPLFYSLLRRGVVRAGLTYLFVGWLLLQIADVVVDRILWLPHWTATMMIYLVIGGLPVALLMAWFLDYAEGHWTMDTGAGQYPDKKSFNKTYIIMLASFAVAGASLSAFHLFVKPFGFVQTEPEFGLVRYAQIPVEPNTIAVLPFLNIDGSDDGRVFSDGLAEDVLDRLARIPGLKVSSRGDAWSLAANSTSNEVRSRLRVAHYLEGSVRVVGNRLRVVVQLINSETGFHLISRRYDRDLDEWFDVQDEITRLTVANLRVALPAATQGLSESLSYDKNLDAYTLYQRGMAAFYQPKSRQSIDEALDWFHQALEEDPEYAAAYAGLCKTYIAGYRAIDESGFIGKAETSCANALALNANLYVVFEAMGDLYRQTGKDAEAESNYRKALSINENDVPALKGLATVYSRSRRLDEAEAYFRRAIDLQPGNWSSYSAYGGFLFHNGRYTDAAREYRKIVSLDPENVVGYTNLATTLMLSGDFKQAGGAFLKALEISPQRTAYSNLGLLYYYLHRYQEAVSTHNEAVRLAPQNHLVWANLGDALYFAEGPGSATSAFGKAEELVDQRLSVNPNEPSVLLAAAWIKTMLGKPDEGEKLIATALDITPSDPYLFFVRALINLRQDRTSESLADLEKAVAMGYSVKMIAAEPYLESLRAEPRFMALLKSSEKS
ncbi:MAG: tetratricopeptide repeat protein [Gammaproteobacteria bacterium]|nr:tetratricopeptide repeat protein [Gammaproteobacteria bacterium]